jgi:hypothetical protein
MLLGRYIMMGMDGGKKVLVSKFETRAENVVFRVRSAREHCARVQLPASAPWLCLIYRPFCSRSWSSLEINPNRCLYSNGQLIVGITIAVYIDGYLNLRIAVW